MRGTRRTTKSKNNLGQTGLSRRARRGDPMRDFDTLPAPLRAWVREAVLPWSPQSCRRIWTRAIAKGASEAEALARLDRAEAATLARAQTARV
ncbi:DUF6525 family protein [Thalassovita mediterranea]|jgi:hypothetical protein|uniref:Uncharacterized protein n=1 Tax=Thalassovita mediterranea TaxID=340021 RepID=A0A0N7M253_9RHOB|nr:DUF6525 family protein [Thalassovita mediterranea]MCG7572986.1 DUF6525 family protein [Phaeobacter sp. CNT1-3]CUH85147.1 hypothetical protein TM5383_02375 [Thalassovita mediterranea]SIS30886.1 hypothetical protein SAMN05421685_103244 [Thalassovita mediterranea]